MDIVSQVKDTFHTMPSGEKCDHESLAISDTDDEDTKIQELMAEWEDSKENGSFHDGPDVDAVEAISGTTDDTNEVAATNDDGVEIISNEDNEPEVDTDAVTQLVAREAHATTEIVNEDDATAMKTLLSEWSHEKKAAMRAMLNEWGDKSDEGKGAGQDQLGKNEAATNEGATNESTANKVATNENTAANDEENNLEDDADAATPEVDRDVQVTNEAANDDDEDEEAAMKALLIEWSGGSADDKSDDEEEEGAAEGGDDEEDEDDEKAVNAILNHPPQQLQDCVLDHIVLAAPDLDVAMEQFKTLTGMAVRECGSMKGIGIRRARIAFDETTYLEIIAPNASQPGPIGQLIVNKRLQELTPFAYAIRYAKTEDLCKQVKQFGYTPDHICMFGAPGDDGTQRKWDMLHLHGHSLGGICPFFINWDNTEHPGPKLPMVGLLKKFSIRAPIDDPIHALMAHINVKDDIIVLEGTPKLSFQFSSPEGTVKFASSKPVGFKFPGFDEEDPCAADPCAADSCADPCAVSGEEPEV